MVETTFATDVMATDAPTTVPIPDGFNANQKIINTSGVDVMVLDGYASSDTATEILYEQSLKLLADNGGSKIIKNGATATYVLDDSYYDDVDKEWEYSYLYNLIIVRADNLFPVKIVGLLPNKDWSGYNDITITAGDTTTPGDMKCMQESQAFQQNLMAYPDSLLSTQFMNKCNDSMNNANSDNDIDSNVNDFFKGTDSYKQVTLNSLTAIQTYWETFPFIWAGYADHKSYYLYSSDSTTVTYVGSLDITAPTTAPASTDKSLTGFTISFSPADNSAKKTLKYIKGQFVDSVETTTIALKGIYQLKSQFTNVATDNVIMAYMSGSVNGKKVIGYNENPKQDSHGNWSGMYSLLHPKDAAGWMALILEVGAVVMTLELFSRPLKCLLDKFKKSRAKNKGEDPSKTDADKMREDAKGKRAQDAAEGQRTMDRMGTDIPIKIEVNININAPMEKLTTDRTNRITEDSRSNFTDIHLRQVDSVTTLSRYANDLKMGEMSTKLAKDKAALDPTKTTTEQFAAQLEMVKTNANSVHETIPIEATKVASKTTAAEKAALAEATKANEEAMETQEEIEKSKETKDKGDDTGIETEDLPAIEK